MSYCECDAPTEFRATSENAGEEFLYLRCGNCGGKAGRVPVDMAEFQKYVTSPKDVEETVTIRLDYGDSPFEFAVEE